MTTKDLSTSALTRPARAAKGSFFEIGQEPVETFVSVAALESWLSKDVTGNAIELPKVAGIPRSLFDLYLARVKVHIFVRQLSDGTFFASFQDLEGLWGEGDSSDEAESDLLNSLTGWLEVRIGAGLRVPPLDGVDPNPTRQRDEQAA